MAYWQAHPCTKSHVVSPESHPPETARGGRKVGLGLGSASSFAQQLNGTGVDLQTSAGNAGSITGDEAPQLIAAPYEVVAQ